MARPAIDTLIKVLLEKGPPRLRDPYLEPADHNRPHGRLGAARGKGVPSGDGDPHPEGRALDIMLFAQNQPLGRDGYDQFIADQLVQAFLDQRAVMKWGGLIYNGQEWNSGGGWTPRLLTKEVRKTILEKRKAKGNTNEAIDQVAFEHRTHIHIQWSDKNADETGFAAALGAHLEKKVFDPGF